MALTNAALAYCALPAGSVVVDVGCGAGTTVRALTAEHHLRGVGVDVCPDLLAQARQENSQARLAQAVAEDLPFAAGSVDAILSECTLSLFEDRDRALGEFARTLKPGGYLVVSDVYVRAVPGGGETERLTRAHIVDRVEAHGFRSELWQDHSAALRQFAAQLIWAGGSLADFCRAEVCTRGLKTARTGLGYYLLVARKGVP